MHEIELIKILAFGLLIALIFGFITQKLKLSPIVGYLIAGFIIGPYFPGYTADIKIATQLAEAGVILLMFGVGLHFNIKELIAVKNVAVLGAIVQSFVATLAGTAVSMMFGLSLTSGLIMGMGLSVASTVVLLKMLEDNNLIDSKEGHIVIGWLIAEDILTVLALVILPTYANTGAGLWEFAETIGISLGKVALFSLITLLLGGKVIPWILTNVAKTRSRELFTLTILATAFSIATVASIYFGVSFALGAFLGGLVVGNTSLHSEATANILPLREAFSVIFFLSVGMLVNPTFIIENAWFILLCVIIVVLIKSATAFGLVIALGKSVKVALTAAVGLAQIGEFSFILAQEAQRLSLITQEVYSVLIGTSIISIAINPILFKLLPKMEIYLAKNETIWKLLNKRRDKKNKELLELSKEVRKERETKAIIIGFGPVGRRVYDELEKQNIKATIIDMNIETVKELTSNKISALYGDATQKDILIESGMKTAEKVFITLPDVGNIINVVSEIMKINNQVKIYSRVRYKGSEEILKSMGVSEVFIEEEAVSNLMIEKISHNKVNFDESGFN